MPMHYPPLSDGTYRYGDEPRPLPSPVPGPDPSVPGPDPSVPGPEPFAPTATPQGQPLPGAQQSGPSGQGATAPHQPPPHSPPHAGPGLPGDGPAPETPTDTRRSNGTVAAVAIVGGLALVVVAVLGFGLLGTGADRGSPTDTLRGPFPQSDRLPGLVPGTGVFTVDGTFTVASTPGEPVSGNSTGCDMPVSLSDIGEGTTLTLLESDTGRSVDSMLAYEGGDLSSCTFTFEFPDVTPGGALYLIELPGRGQLVYSEDELRAGVEISLGQ